MFTALFSSAFFFIYFMLYSVAISRHRSTIPTLFKYVFFLFHFQIFNILAIKFVQSAEYPYYAVKGYIPFDALPIAAIVFSAITLTLLICIPRLQTSIIWLRYEWFILCCLITVYCYALIYFIGATVQCHDEAPDNRGCPWQLSALVSLMV